MAKKPQNLFGVVRRVVPAHGIKVGCRTEIVAAGLTQGEANELADKLHARNPSEDYALIEMVYRRWLYGSEA